MYFWTEWSDRVASSHNMIDRNDRREYYHTVPLTGLKDTRVAWIKIERMIYFIICCPQKRHAVWLLSHVGTYKNISHRDDETPTDVVKSSIQKALHNQGEEGYSLESPWRARYRRRPATSTTSTSHCNVFGCVWPSVNICSRLTDLEPACSRLTDLEPTCARLTDLEPASTVTGSTPQV